MKHAKLFLLLPSLVAWVTLAGPTAQDPQDPGDDQDEETLGLSPWTKFQEEESRRLLDEIEGTWNLLAFHTVDESIDPEDFRGYAQFQDGYMTLILSGAEDNNFIFGPSVQYALLAGVYRYRFSEYGTLQLATLFGYDNQTPNRRLAFHRPGEPTEFDVTLDEGILDMRRPGGVRYEFRKLGASEFPEDAIDELRSRSSGLQADDPTDPDDYEY